MALRSAKRKGTGSKNPSSEGDSSEHRNTSRLVKKIENVDSDVSAELSEVEANENQEISKRPRLRTKARASRRRTVRCNSSDEENSTVRRGVSHRPIRKRSKTKDVDTTKLGLYLTKTGWDGRTRWPRRESAAEREPLERSSCTVLFASSEDDSDAYTDASTDEEVNMRRRTA